MSEQPDRDKSNLCTTVDAFEKFQAINMHEEDEYSVPSDVLPTQHSKQNAQDVEKEKLAKPLDSEIMLLSNTGSDQYVNTSRILNDDDEPMTKEKLVELPPVNIKNNNTNPEVVESNTKDLNPNENNDKLKSTIHERFISEQYRSQESESIQDIHNFIKSTEIPLLDKNKSEKPKNEADQTTVKQIRSSKISPTPTYSETKKTYKTRGRLRKQSTEQTASNDPDKVVSSDVNNTKPNVSNEYAKDKTCTTTPCKRGIGKKISKQDNIHTKSDAQIVKPHADASDLKTKQLYNLPENVKQKKVTKRGRLKKNSSKTICKQIENQLSTESIEYNNVNEFDNEDDVCLSKLNKNDDINAHKVDSTLEQITVTTEVSSTIENEACNTSTKIQLSENLLENINKDTCLNLNTESMSESDTKVSRNSLSDSVIQVDDDGDDICLSKLKESKETLSDDKSNENLLIPQKRNSKKTIMSDFEYNIDSIVNDNVCHDELQTSDKNTEQAEEGSKRSVRRKAKQFHYDEGSDEDPFANVELSDDDSFKTKKGRYYSDDEYIPGRKKGENTYTESSESESNVLNDETKKLKRKKITKKSDSTSPRKRGRKSNTEKVVEANIQQIDEIEQSVKPSLIKTNDEGNSQSNTWGSSNEFENFLAMRIQGTNLKIKKVSSRENTESTITPLQIPTIDPNELKKTVEMSSQTKAIATSVAAVQTSARYDIPLKENVPLTSEQSKKGCEFLKSIVKTTAELGQLMTQKSNDFIKKKINIENVTDTFKMDYCVKKTFLLLKLAKHNLTQMEEDLAQQYELFLHENNLSHCREEPVQLLPTVKDNDSDCEIVEEPVMPIKTHKKTEALPKFNPKTVFLNKELSIKITKKPSEEKKLNIKGRNTVWINDSVMVKKVKPTQSFLAQDSRNKKPPDYKYVTLEMVSDFFEKYYHQRMLVICAQFTSQDWLIINKDCICNYFVVKPDMNDSDNQNVTIVEEFTLHTPDNIQVVPDINPKVENAIDTKMSNPQTLLTLCIQTLQNHIYIQRSDITSSNSDSSAYQFADKKFTRQPETLIQLSLKVFSNTYLYIIEEDSVKKCVLNICSPVTFPSLSQLCYKRIKKMLFQTDLSLEQHSHYNIDNNFQYTDDITNINDNSCIILENSSVISSKIKNGVFEIKSLLNLCVTSIQKNLLYEDNTLSSIESDFHECRKFAPKSLNIDNNFQYKGDITNFYDKSSIISENSSVISSKIQNGMFEMKSLLNLCVNFIQKNLLCEDNTVSSIDSNSHKCRNFSPKSLKYITYKNIVCLLHISNGQTYDKQAICNYDEDDTVLNNIPENNEVIADFFNINSVNTLSEEAFLNLNIASSDIQQHLEDVDNYDDDNSIFSNNEFENNDHDEEDNLLDSSWISKVQMQELKSGICLTTQSSDNEKDSNEIEKEISVQVKVEPIEDISSNIVDVSIVKTEHMPGLDEMTIIPENFVPKSEVPECSDANDDCILNCSSSSYDATIFEEFLSSNKLITSQSMYEDSEVFSQSILRVSGFHEPDYDSEVDRFDSLLIPQTYKTLHVENAKNCLMESNSEDDNVNTKTGGRKKIEKRKVKRKIVKVSNKNTPPIVKDLDSSQNSNEIATMTTRMRDKIRQKEKELASSNSEGEGDLNMNFKKAEDSKKCKTKPVGEVNNSEIQCNNVDSTQKTTENLKTFSNNDKIIKEGEPNENEFSSISDHSTDKIPLNEIMTRTRKGRKEKNTIDNSKESHSPLIDYEGPVELLQCEPAMPIFDDIVSSKSDENSSNSNDPKTKSYGKDVQDLVTENNDNNEFIDRHGWKCFRIDCNDGKLFQNVKIVLDKLPETFVQTYFQYQDIMDTQEEDLEIERLTNLNSLNRSTKDNKNNTKKRRVLTEQEKLESVSSEANDKEVNNEDSENFDELMPSEDEEKKIEDQPLSLLALQTPENNMAKDLLMNDNDSDDATNIVKIKEESKENITRPKRRPGPKSKMGVTVPDNSELMLTADKVMNTELMLLNGPVTFSSEAYIPNQEPVTKKKQKPVPTKTYFTRERMKIEKEEEDYSSEEEKRWINTKEKLLKNTDKKDNASVSDAKHTKLVNEFIERRSGKTRQRKIIKCRRSRKKLLEQQKQLSVLYKELYGVTLESVTGAHNYNQRSAKGQRNSGKGVVKKSNKSKNELVYPILFEESERTKRLYARQAQLRQVLGCEENETVQVIEDKVCLEYDFEAKKPVVSIHPFFTEVMKEHQYAGVKFMWDACFESLADIAKGHRGSGCILAHCMGLGKTLQVLALLHTVMTHPRVKMRRVLVCCPLSTVLNWVDEIHKWIGPVTNKIKVFELSKLKKTYQRAYQLEDWFKGGGIFIIGYELFRSLTTLDPMLDNVRANVINKIRTALLDPGPDIIICDEGHLLKNDYSILTMAMSRVATKRRIVLTGTPMQNNLREYYCMVNFIKPNLLGSYTEFYKRFENPIINGQHRDSTEEDTKLMNSCTYILHKVLEGCLQRQEVSVMYPYLPKKHEYTVFVTLTQHQWNLYRHYMYNYAKETKQNVLKDFHTLQKIWSHPQVLHNFHTKSLMNKTRMKEEKFEDDLAQEDLAADMKPSHEESWWLPYLEEGQMLDSIESSNKFLAVFRILEECVEIGNKVLIFSTSLFTLDSLEYFLKKTNNWSLGQDYFRLDGSVPPEVRQKWCREFNAENNHKTKLFLISTRAGCLGLNMTAANRVIILDTSWNPAHDIQSIFRVYRFGQKRDCFIYRLVAMGTMEQKIYERSVTKQAVACRVLDEQLIERHYSSADLNELYLYDESGMTVPAGVSVGVADAVILRVARDAPIHAVQEHDSLLRGSSEQGLPEHERTAAWNKFQQEHAHKKMQNKTATTKGQKQLKNSKEPENIAPDNIIETIQKNDPNDETKLSSKTPTTISSRGRKPVNANCYIPIKKDDDLGPSKETAVTFKNKALEELMVKKISEILIKHNYYNEEETKISELVNKVRNIIVTGGNCATRSGKDELSKSIADILLQKEMSIPTMTDIMCESINNTINVSSSDEETKGRKRKHEVTVAEVSKLVPDDTNESDNGKRKKRKAALAAEKSLELNMRKDCDLDSINPENSDIKRRSKRLESSPEGSSNPSKPNSKTDDARNDGGNNSKKLIAIVEHNANTNGKEVNKIQICLENDNNKKRKSLANEARLLLKAQTSKLNNDDQTNDRGSRKLSKVLSESSHDLELKKQLIDLTDALDDEHDNGKRRKVAQTTDSKSDDVIDLTEKTDSASKSAAKKSKSIKTKNHKVTDEQKQSNVKSNNVKERHKTSEKEVVPLHPSILKNENFVKIVAHHYLKDNPMMTQEVAVLAARHNINAALRICESGKTICSGDIYDKAVEILGMDMLKGLHTMGEEAKEPTQAKKYIVDVPIRTEELSTNTSPKSIVIDGSKKTAVTIQNQDTSMRSFKVFQMRSKADMNSAPSVVQPPVQPQPLICDVVPVGLFKGPANIQVTENFQQDVDCDFQIIDEDECILPDDDNSAPSTPLKIVPQRHSNSTPTVSATKPSSQIVTASDSTVTPTRPVITVPFKVTSGPKACSAGNIRKQTLSTRKTVTPTATPSPSVATKPASTDKEDLVVILSDDEEPPTTNTPTLCLTVARPPDGGPVPVALTAAGDTHNAPPKLTVIRSHNPRPKTNITPNTTPLKQNKNAPETSTPHINKIQQAPVSSLINRSRIVQSTSSPSTVPIILRKLVPTTKPQPCKSVEPTRTTPTPENSTMQSGSSNNTALNVSNLKSQKPDQSIFNNIVHILAPEYTQNSNKTELVPQFKQKQIVNDTPITCKTTDTSSTSKVILDTTKQHRILKVFKTSESPLKFQITNSTKKTEQPSKLQMTNCTKKSEPPSKLQMINSTKKSEPPSKLQMTNCTKKSEPPSKLQIANSNKKSAPLSKSRIPNNTIIDLTDEPSTSNKTVHSSKVTPNKTYSGPRNPKSICEKYNVFKNVVLKRNDADKIVSTNESLKKKTVVGTTVLIEHLTK